MTIKRRRRRRKKEEFKDKKCGDYKNQEKKRDKGQTRHHVKERERIIVGKEDKGEEKRETI